MHHCLLAVETEVYMGKQWKYTNDNFKLISGEADKKATAAFDLDTGCFLEHASEISEGFKRLDRYVEEINKNNGYVTSKLEGVYQDISGVDSKYAGKFGESKDQIDSITKIIVKFSEVVKGNLPQFKDGFKNVNFTFDYDELKKAVDDEKHELEEKFVDTILSKDVDDITDEEYADVVELILERDSNDTSLVEHILQSGYCWDVVDADGNPIEKLKADPTATQIIDVFTKPTEKYDKIKEMLDAYAIVYIKTQSVISDTDYKNKMKNATLYSQLFNEIEPYVENNSFGFEINPGESKSDWKKRKNKYLKEAISLEYKETSIITAAGTEKDGKRAEKGIVVTINGANATEVEILSGVPSDRAVNVLSALQNAQINTLFDVDTDKKPGEVVADGVLKIVIDKVMDAADKKFPGISQVKDVRDVLSILSDADDQRNINDNICKIEKTGTDASTIQLLNFQTGVTVVHNTAGNDEKVIIYEQSDTQKRVDRLNDYIKNELPKQVDDKSVTKNIPKNGYTVEYIRTHLNSVDSQLDAIDNAIYESGKTDVQSLSEALDNYKSLDKY